MEYSQNCGLNLHIPRPSSTGQGFPQLGTITEGTSRHIFMAKNRTPNLAVAEPGSSHLSLEKKEKGRSMWELLLEMRVLLPYLGRLIPLLDGGLVKPSPDVRALHQSLAEVQTGNRDLEVQARNQALQMERIEAQMARMRVAHENAAEETSRLYAEVRTLRRTLLAMGVTTIVILLITAGLVSFLLIHP